MNSLGIYENNSPVILEYKRVTNETVIHQGQFYLDWLQDHKADSQLLVMDRLGREISDAVDWTIPGLCVTGGLSKYDEHAVKQMGRSIELIR